MWGIGLRMEKNLNKLGLYKIGDIAHYNKNKLKEKFGIIGLELWYHANGIDLSKISDFNGQVKDKSISHSQVLFKDYNGENIQIIIREMIEVLTKRLRDNKKQTALIGIGIGYSKSVGGGFYHMQKLDNATTSEKLIYDVCINIFDRYYEDFPIRKVSISFGKLSDDTGVQLNLFQNFEDIKIEKQGNIAIDEIRKKFGNNSILKASSLLNDSTIKERNKKIGGHNAG